MPKFDSPIGVKSFAGQQLREFDVPEGGVQFGAPPSGNPSSRLGGYAPQMDAALEFQEKLEREQFEETNQFENEVKAAREARRTGKVRLTEGAKRRLEMLMNMSRTVRDCEIDGNKYSLQSLSGKEMRSAIMAASNYDSTVQSPFEIRRQFLAYSICMVAGLDIVQFIGTNDFEAKLELIDNLDEALLNRLYDEYLEMVREAREKFAIKNDQDAKEVVEDLKK